MSNYINTFSYSVKYDLKESFEYNEEFINKFLFKIQDYIKEKEEENIKNYKGLKEFLGKKRKLIEEENAKENKKDLQQNSIKNKENIKDEEEKKYFKKEITKENFSIFIDTNKDINLKIKEKENIEILTIYNDPVAIIEIYEQNSININLINDNITFMNKYNNLKEYDLKIYSLDDNLEIICDKSINEKIVTKSFKIQNENFKFYLSIIKSIIPKIEDKDLELKNIYPKDEIDEDGNIFPEKNISKIFFYYFNINLELQKKYKYIASKNRIILFQILSKFFSNNIRNILIICGAKGIGKTTSLIRFSFKKIYNIFYFNLEVFNKYKNDDIQIKELQIQLNKLFGDYVDLDSEGKIKNKIEDYIKTKKNKDGLEFIYNIINLFIKFTDKLNINGSSPFGFIIDQYSINYKTNSDYDIYKIIDLVKISNKINLIICPTINNIFSKEQIDYLFNESLNITKNKNISIYYFQELIEKDDIIENILKDEKNEYFAFMEETGYIPKLFYDSKLSDIKTYKDQAKKMLKAGKNFDDIILIVSQGLEGMLNKLHKNLDGKIELFNQKTQNLVDDIKDMTSLFNQLEFEKNEQYKNNFDQLINSGKDIFIEKTKESGILYSLKKTWSSLWTSVVDFFRSFKGKEIAIIEKIDDLRTETLENLNNKERIINFNFDDEKKKIEQNFNSILALAFSDLSNIEEKEWIESKEQYLKAKKYLLPSEEIELFNDIEKKDEGGEKKEEEKIIEESKKSQEK